MEADALIQRNELRQRRVSVQKEEEIAARMVPERQLVRPLLVVVPADHPVAGRRDRGGVVMAASDALIVGEDWISEHYFTTDAKSESFQAKVTERRKAWDEDAKRRRRDTVRSRFIAARGPGRRSPTCSPIGRHRRRQAARTVRRLRTMLGYNTGEYTLKQTGPVIRVIDPGPGRGRAAGHRRGTGRRDRRRPDRQDGTTLLSPYEADEKTTYTSVARLLSALFVADDGPEFALVLAGRWLLVAERARWAEGRYLAVDLQLVCDRNDDQERRRDRPCPHLRERGVARAGRRGRHLVARRPRGLRQAHRRRSPRTCARASGCPSRSSPTRWCGGARPKGLDPLPQDQAQPLARQALRYLYRILFLLYAEASPELEVLPVGAEEYDQGYGLDRLRELTLVELAGPRAIERHAPVRLARQAVHARRQGPPAAGGARTASRTAWSSTACAPTCSCRRRPR